MHRELKVGSHRGLYLVWILSLLLGPVAGAAKAKPKYGPRTTPLSQDHAYLLKHTAPDYWMMSPYYLAQRDGSSCSLASFTMAFNGLRSSKKLTADDKLITQDSLLDKINHAAWNRMFKDHGRTADLDEFGEIAKKALTIYGIEGKTVEILHVNLTSLDQNNDQNAAQTSAQLANVTAKVTAQVRDILVKNEKSAQDLVIVNALQSELTGDPEGAVGHVVTVGAFDAAKNRVLIMDPDREYYEPYWVDLLMLIKGMNTLDKGANKNRGLIWIH